MSQTAFFHFLERITKVRRPGHRRQVYFEKFFSFFEWAFKTQKTNYNSSLSLIVIKVDLRFHIVNYLPGKRSNIFFVYFILVNDEVVV